MEIERAALRQRYLAKLWPKVEIRIEDNNIDAEIILGKMESMPLLKPEIRPVAEPSVPVSILRSWKELIVSTFKRR